MSPLEQKSEDVADVTLAWYVNAVKNNWHLRDVFNQFVRSATSIGANIAESKFAQSDNDYKSKMNIALKEANETKYWIVRLTKLNVIDVETETHLFTNVEDIIRILISLCRK